MQFEQRSAGDVVILKVTGTLVLGGVAQLRHALDRLLDEDQKHIVLDLAEVSYIDSAGLGVIVRTYTTLSRRGGTLRLSNVRKEIGDLFSMTKTPPMPPPESDSEG